MLLEQVQMSPYEIEQFHVPKPTRRLSVNLQGARSEGQTMAAVLQGGHIRVGIEDHADAESNVNLVQRAVDLAEKVGRSVATPAETADLLHLPSRVSR
jgi:uncharacterized protein (DUF849 family)